METVAELLELQSGVISRRQATARGLVPHELARLKRRRELVQVHPGVFVNHTGELTWLQRAWAGVLACWPAALTHQSALRSCEGPGRRIGFGPEIHVAVDRDRHLVVPPGVVLHRIVRFRERVMWNASPPRLCYEDAALETAGDMCSEFEALGVLAAVVQSRRTTALRILTSADARPRLPRREWTLAVLRDIADGTCSVLEHGYLRRVERPHGLKRGRRQAPAASSRGTIYRDVHYDTGLDVELDGRLFHDTTRQRDADFDRDLDAAVDGRDVVRVSWGQVFARPCWTASRIALLQWARGWSGRPVSCGPGCDVAQLALCG